MSAMPDESKPAVALDVFLVLGVVVLGIVLVAGVVWVVRGALEGDAVEQVARPAARVEEEAEPPNTRPAEATSRTANALFKEGRSLVTQGRYAHAVPTLEQYLREHPRGKHASRAGLFLGKAHLGLGQWDEAAAAFTLTIERYPQSLEAHKARYKLAVVALLRGDTADARDRFAAMARSPDGPLAPEAKAAAEFLAAALAATADDGS